MPISHLLQKPSQAWIWQPPMDSHQLHHHYFQVQQEQEGNYGREQMFEKPLTPSDVGKLNRLVIPKQHAEKYFPLDSESGEKGLLLNFEDESGKAWRFRYSYWTSSQSYVLTKGWSRFVKEKRLDAGDIVLFERCRPGNGDRLYIGCRRRGSPDPRATAVATTPALTAAGPNVVLPWSPAFYTASSSYPNSYFPTNSVNKGEQAGGAVESTAASTTTGNSKRLRLFGVNLECAPDQPEPQHLVSGSWNQFMPTNGSTSQL